MLHYFRETLRVPDSQIVTLFDERATREAIIAAFKQLSADTDIQPGSPILIYYAGHGTTMLTPLEWKNGSKMTQAIVPYDCCTVLNPAKPNDKVQPIPDRTLGALLHKIAGTVITPTSNTAPPKDATGKGNNITVIFDCCHSGSGTREPERAERGVVLKDWQMPSELDNDIVKGVPEHRASLAVAATENAGTQSHILLAACAPDERAQEFRKGSAAYGAFTQALLVTLRDAVTAQITYRQLHQRLPVIAGQSPQCEGSNAGRILFNYCTPNQAFDIHRVSKRGANYILHADSAIHNIPSDTIFDVYASPDLVEKPLAKMIVHSLGDSESVMQLWQPIVSSTVSSSPDALPQDSLSLPSVFRQEDIPDECHAVQSTFPDQDRLTLYIPSDVAMLEPLRLDIERDLKSSVKVVGDETQAHLSLALIDGMVEYRTMDQLLKSNGLERLNRKTAPSAVAVLQVLRAAVRFFRFLHRKSPNAHLRRVLELKYLELAESDELSLNDLSYIYKPIDDKNLIVNGTVKVRADGKTAYGLTLHNKAKVGLYIALFYFDCGSLAIREHYARNVEDKNVAKAMPNLAGESILALGHSDSGIGYTERYFLPDERDLDVGIFKLFVSTWPVDVAAVAQPSPFEADPVPKDVLLRQIEQRARETVKLWDSLQFAVIQKRASVNEQ